MLKIEKSEKELGKLNSSWSPSEQSADQELLTEEERQLFKRIGLKMDEFVLLDLCTSKSYEGHVKFSSKASPSSSIDSFVSEGSSSTSTSIKPSNSVESLSSATSSSPSVVSIEQPCIKKDASSNRLQSQPTAKGSLGTRVLSEPSNKDHAIRSSTSSNTGAKNFKPSGLRMPSPKIGYFDAEKTQVSKSPNNFSKIGLRSSLVKGGSIGTNDNVGTNKPKFSRIPSLRPAAPQTTKPASPSQIERSS